MSVSPHYNYYTLVFFVVVDIIIKLMRICIQAQFLNIYFGHNFVHNDILLTVLIL